MTTSEKPALLHRVICLKIIKPLNMDWKQLGELLRETRYRVYRLGNLALSDAYLQFHLHRSGQSAKLQKKTIGQLNKELAKQLTIEQKAQKRKNSKAILNARFSQRGEGALPATVIDALSMYKIKALTANTKWQEVVKGKSSLPSFRLTSPIYIRADKSNHKKLERLPNGDTVLDLLICQKPYPRVLLAAGFKDGSARETIEKLLDPQSGYRQRYFEVRYVENKNQWWLHVSFDFPPQPQPGLSKDRIVGVDLGWKCPLYAAIGHGHARLGYRAFAPLAARIKALQSRTMARRRSMLGANRSSFSEQTARAGHGRKRMLQSTEKLQGRIDDAYTTLNHQLARAVVDFAVSQGAGVIQMEDLTGLQDTLRSTFLGQRWQYHSLQKFIEDKAVQVGIELRKINPYYTSRRCSKCGTLRPDFDREYRNQHPREPFRCSNLDCRFETDPDYNAARNLAVPDIEEKIKLQCREQKLEHRSLKTMKAQAETMTPADPVDASSTKATSGAIDAPGGEGPTARPKG